MKRFTRLFLTLAVLVGALAMPLSATAGGDKVTLCHKPNTPDEVTIEVSVNALEAHLAHGDYQGECTHVKVLTCPFDATAIPVIGPDIVKYTVDFPDPTPGFWWASIWSSTGQSYLIGFAPNGSPPPTPDQFVEFTGEPRNADFSYAISLDFYIGKVNPEDPDFDHMISCTAILPPPPP